MKMGNLDSESSMYDFIPLTPIHIGSGHELLPYNYILKDEIYYKIDISEIYENLSEENQLKFNEEIQKGMVSFRAYLNEMYDEKYGFIYKGKASKKFTYTYNSKLRGSGKSYEENQLIIKEFIESLKGKYIPGSSIKGAIRTAYLSEMAENIEYKLGRKDSKTAPFVLLSDDGKFQITNKKQVSEKAKELEAKILNLTNLNPKADPFKNVFVGDTFNIDELIEVISIERVSKNPEKNSMPMGNVEATKSLFSSGLEIALPFRMSFKNFRLGTFKGYVREILEETNIYEDDIFETLNNKARKILNDDLRFFKDAKNIEVEKIVKKLEEVLD
ncbi:MAG: type III-A CRISPR-associated RAMP protein Csm5, partial [Cetobacterium sp.]